MCCYFNLILHWKCRMKESTRSISLFILFRLLSSVCWLKRFVLKVFIRMVLFLDDLLFEQKSGFVRFSRDIFFFYFPVVYFSFAIMFTLGCWLSVGAWHGLRNRRNELLKKYKFHHSLISFKKCINDQRNIQQNIAYIDQFNVFGIWLFSPLSYDKTRTLKNKNNSNTLLHFLYFSISFLSYTFEHNVLVFCFKFFFCFAERQRRA